MSFKALNWAEDTTTGSAACKSVLVWLANYADESHSCFPRVSTLVKVTELKESAVREAIKKLAAAQLIKTLARYDKRGARIQNRYLLMVEGPGTPMPPFEDYVDEQTYTAIKPRDPGTPTAADAAVGHAQAVTAAAGTGDEDDEYDGRDEPDGRPVPAHVEGWPVNVDSAQTQQLPTPPPGDGPAPLQQVEGPPSISWTGPPPPAEGPPSSSRGASLQQVEGLYKEEPSVDPPVEPPGGTVKTPPPPPPVAHPGSNPEEEDSTMITKVLDDALRADADAVLAAVTKGLSDVHRPGPTQIDQLRALTMAALRAGWTRQPLVARLRAGNVADAKNGAFVVLRHRLGDLPDLRAGHRASAAGLPSAWCGDPSCDPVTRQLLNADGQPMVRHDDATGRRFPLMCPTCASPR